jgi:hypothetical protein
MEDERVEKAREEACDIRAPGASVNAYDEDELLCADHLSDDKISLCDWRNPKMDLGSRYKDMVTFRLAMRQYAIKREFELGIEANSTTQYRDYCKDWKCP